MKRKTKPNSRKTKKETPLVKAEGIIIGFRDREGVLLCTASRQEKIGTLINDYLNRRVKKYRFVSFCEDALAKLDRDEIAEWVQRYPSSDEERLVADLLIGRLADCVIGKGEKSRYWEAWSVTLQVSANFVTIPQELRKHHHGPRAGTSLPRRKKVNAFASRLQGTSRRGTNLGKPWRG